jgi:hypothetical protein
MSLELKNPIFKVTVLDIMEIPVQENKLFICISKK